MYYLSQGNNAHNHLVQFTNVYGWLKDKKHYARVICLVRVKADLVSVFGVYQVTDADNGLDLQRIFLLKVYLY